MIQEEKQLLLRDLCARLAFGRVKCQVKVVSFNEEMDEHIELLDDEITFIEPGIYNAYLYKEGTDVDISDIKPYLRPMSSMTEEEKMEVQKLDVCYDGAFHNDIYDIGISMEEAFTAISWLLERHFDINYLIEKGLALEAPKNMYKTE